MSARDRSTPAPSGIRVLVTRLGNLAAALGRAEGEAKAEVCAALGLRLTYEPNKR